MGKKRSRNTLKKEAAKKAKLDRKRQIRNITAIVACAVIAVIAVTAMLLSRSDGVIFKYKKGAYIDPKTDKVYCAADTSAYLIKTEFYKDNYYGKMSGDKVYTIPGVKGKSWLVRRLTDDIYQLYHEESVVLPSISEFEPKEMYIFVDAPLIFYREEIKDKTELDGILHILNSGEKLETIGEITETYSIRFVSDKYSHMYFCYEYVVTEDGSYFYDHVSFSYIKSNGILDGYVASLKENEGE